jgi:hypothetical protein
MRIAYLTLVHRNPQLLKRAIGTLSSEDCAFFIHVDQKTNNQEFSGISGDNIFFSVQRIPVYWAEFSNVEAITQLIRQALDSSAKYDYLVIMQGSDYPLRGGRYIQRFLENNIGWEFMSMVKMPAPGYPLSKINTVRFTSDKPLRRFASRALAKLGLAQRDYRKHLGGLEPYAGDACWSLSRDACQYVLDFSARNQSVEKYFRYTHVPEESFFHTILGNSSFRPRVRRSLLYRDWPTPGHHPAMLNDKHLRFFESQDKVLVEDEWGSGEVLFARKFSDDNLGLVDRIDEMIRRKGEHCAATIPRVNA